MNYSCFSRPTRRGFSPVWRGLKKIKDPEREDQTRYSSDLQIFDLEWIHKTHNGLKTKSDFWDDIFNNIFTSSEFDFVKANKIAKAELIVDMKLLNLKIPDHIQQELAVLRSDKIRKRLERAKIGADEVEMDLRNAAFNNLRRGVKLLNNIDSRVNVWISWELSGDNKSFKNIATNYHRMTGEKINLSTLRNKLRSTDAALKEVSSQHSLKM